MSRNGTHDIALEDLASPDRTVRLYAIEQATRGEASVALVEVLKQRQQVETDRDVRILLAQALVSVNRRLNAVSGPMAASEDLVRGWRNHFTISAPSERLELLGNLTTAMLPALAPQCSAWFEREQQPEVAAALLRTFAPVWPAGALGVLEQRLQSSEGEIRLAALEIIAQRDAPRLIGALPQLLTVADPRTRAVAVQTLARIDADEAVAHLEAMLIEGAPEVRLAAIQCAFLLDFATVKPVLMKHLAAESSPDLLHRAGLLLRVNPDLEIPYRVFDLLERSEPAKAAALKPILQATCQVIKDAGVLGERYGEYQKRLQTFIHQRAAVRHVQKYLDRLGDPGGLDDATLLETVRCSLQQPVLRGAWQQALTWPLAADVHGWLQRELACGETVSGGPALANTTVRPEPTASPDIPIAASPPAAPADATGQLPASTSIATARPADGPPATDTFDRLPLDEAIRRVAAWCAGDLPAVLPQLTRLLRDADTPDDLRATAFRTAVTLSVPGFADAADKHGTCSRPSLATAALEYLGFADPDRFFAQLGRLLKSGSARVKAVALRILNRHDPAQALSRLRLLLATRDPAQQRVALALMINFDFPLTRDLLFDFLAGRPDEDLINAGFCLFRANPHADNLFPLYFLQRKLAETIGRQAGAVQKDTARQLIELGLLDAQQIETLEAGFPARWDDLVKKTQKPPPAYSVKALRQAAAAGAAESLGVALARRWPAIAALLVLSLGWWWVWSSPAVDPAVKRAGAKLALSRIVTGTVRAIDKGTGMVTLMTDNGFVFIKPAGGVDLAVTVGERLKAKVVPFRVTADGETIAMFESRVNN